MYLVLIVYSFICEKGYTNKPNIIVLIEMITFHLNTC